jgi:hypothetical protein
MPEDLQQKIDRDCKERTSRDLFAIKLSDLLSKLFTYNSTDEQRDREIKNWLKLAAFNLRNRKEKFQKLRTKK